MMQSTKMEANRVIYVGALTMIFDGAKVQRFSVITWLLFGYYLVFVCKAFVVGLCKFDIFFCLKCEKIDKYYYDLINLFNTLNAHNGAKCGEISANDVIAHSAILPLRCWSGLSRAFFSTDCGRCASLFWRILRFKSRRTFPWQSEVVNYIKWTKWFINLYHLLPLFLYSFLLYENLVSAKLSCNFAPDNQLNQHNCGLI